MIYTPGAHRYRWGLSNDHGEIRVARATMTATGIKAAVGSVPAFPLHGFGHSNE